MDHSFEGMSLSWRIFNTSALKLSWSLSTWIPFCCLRLWGIKTALACARLVESHTGWFDNQTRCVHLLQTFALDGRIILDVSWCRNFERRNKIAMLRKDHRSLIVKWADPKSFGFHLSFFRTFVIYFILREVAHWRALLGVALRESRLKCHSL